MSLLMIDGVHRTISADALKIEYQAKLRAQKNGFRETKGLPGKIKKWMHNMRLRSIEAAYQKMQIYIKIRHNKIKGKQLTLADEMDHYFDSSSCIIL